VDATEHPHSAPEDFTVRYFLPFCILALLTFPAFAAEPIDETDFGPLIIIAEVAFGPAIIIDGAMIIPEA
jgi:hypothetical protein